VHESHDPDTFIGLLLVKKLIKYDPAIGLLVSSFPLLILPEPSVNCFQAWIICEFPPPLLLFGTPS
jgi:metal transporter CNNM